MTPSHLDKTYDAVIIGAGAAGLSCALGIIREWERLHNGVSAASSAQHAAAVEADENRATNTATTAKASDTASPHRQVNSDTPPSILVLSKVQPLRSHTGSAEGGIAASLGNIEPDTWEWHYRDTVKGGDWLVDQDAAKVLAQSAPATVIQLEHDGVAFSRTADGHIAQRRFGGHTAAGEKPVRRVAYAADRIGHQILHTLWQQCQRYDIQFADEWYVTDLVLSDASSETGDAQPSPAARICGIIALDEQHGTLHSIAASSVVLATGGAGRLYHTTSNSWDLTGDGMGLVLQAGLPLEDIEFVQFHPTGLGHTGILLSEAARGEGGILRNKDLEPFMQRYAPGVGDLAARDVVARAINREVAEGRGVGDPLSPDSPDDCVWLDLRSIEKERLEEVLPEVCDTIRSFAGLDPATDLIPIKPTAHYTMGGIPIDLEGRVYMMDAATQKRHTIRGLRAAGECSCVSVHGANRLGANSLLDAVVFGTRAGASIAQELVSTKNGYSPSNTSSPAAYETSSDAAPHATENEYGDTAEDSSDTMLSELIAAIRGAHSDARRLAAHYEERQRILTSLLPDTSTPVSVQVGEGDKNTGNISDNPYQLMTDLGIMMESHIGVSCAAASIQEAIDLLRKDFIPRAAQLRAHDSSTAFNQEACAILEARNLVKVALAMSRATLKREESRGSLYREDYPERNDADFLAHSFTRAEGEISYKPVVIDDYPPQKRSY